MITYREWHPVGAEEYGYVAADPLDPILFMAEKFQDLINERQTQNISPKQ
jgi:hypothetical protein